VIEAIVPLGVDALTIVEEEAAKAYGRAARSAGPAGSMRATRSVTSAPSAAG